MVMNMKEQQKEDTATLPKTKLDAIQANKLLKK